jgi:gliding motility-associated protein GldL
LSNIDTSGLAEGIKKFGEFLGKLDVFSEVATSAGDLSGRLHNATEKVDEFSDAYGKSTKELTELADELSSSCKNTTKDLSASADGLVTAYKQASSDVVNLGKDTSEIVATSGKQMSKIVEESLLNIANIGNQTGEMVKDSGTQMAEMLKMSAEKTTQSYEVVSQKMNEIGMQSVEIVAATGTQMAEVVKTAANVVAQSYKAISNQINKVGTEACDVIVVSGKQLSQVLMSATDSFAETFTLIDQHIKENLDELVKGNANYNTSLESLNKNMSALNAGYDLQVQEVIKYQKRSAEIGRYMEAFVDDLSKSATENQAFCKELSHLSSNIGELNSIYGNMLSAMQTVAKRA